MTFNSFIFALFFPAVVVLHGLLRSHRSARHVLLLAASYTFYGYWNWRFLGLILFSTLLDYSIGKALERSDDPRRRKRLLLASLVGNLGCLGFFKYWNFFAGELQRILEGVGLRADPLLLEIVLPVGISFYTFQTLSYTIDIYRRQLSAEPSLLRFALFVAFFPQLVAGPIVRASHFLPQLRRDARTTPLQFESGLALMAWGLVKKVVFADVIGRGLVDPFWADTSGWGGLAALLPVYGYAFQIYGDFSGYSDIAIGAARILGYDLGRNFDAPYRATSPRDFWRRWHISLSTWLRDYLYIPMGGNQKGAMRTRVNLLNTMLLGGLWHGASWMFVAWGAFHGALLGLDRLLGIRESTHRRGQWLQRLVVFHAVCLGWILFRSRTVPDALEVLATFGRSTALPSISPWVWVALVLAAVTQLLRPRWKLDLRLAFLRVPATVRGVAYALLLGLVANAQGDTPFIYFQF